MIAPVLRNVFRKDRIRSQAETLYAALANQSRAPEFYEKSGAPDTPEGRFDMLALHIFLAIERLRREKPATERLTRLLQEAFFKNLDAALREMGVGDLSVGRKIRGLAEAFYGRVLAYDRALTDEGDALEAALARNVMGTDDANAARPLAGYVRAARAQLEKAPVESLAEAIGSLDAVSKATISGGTS